MKLIQFLLINMKKFRRTPWLNLSALLAASCLFASHASAQALPSSTAAPAVAASGPVSSVDEIVAIVNADVITKRELEQRASLVFNRLQQEKAQLPDPQQLRSQVLEQIILERIQLQRAKDDGLTVDDAAVDRTLERLAASNGLSLPIYRSRIEAQGVPWSLFTTDARNELLLDKVRQKEVDSKITVSDAEVANYLATHRGPGNNALSDLHLQHILINLPENATPAEQAAAQDKVQAVLKEAAGGRDFGKLVKEYSQDIDAAKGGDLGFRAPDTLPDGYVSAASKMRPGEVAQTPVRTAHGLQIIKLIERRPSRGPSGNAVKISQTHAEHILLRVGDGASEGQVLQKIQDIRRQIQEGGDFASFARTYSQDGSASQGGDLGWISPGETVPEFERAMNQLKVGQVSDPVRTEFGYHLIEVLDRRSVEGSTSEQQDNARQVMGARKAAQAYSDWLRELRDNSYIQYKPGYSPS
jgi:peptidyl-prolyl cis-trans isomerase SurA